MNETQINQIASEISITDVYEYVKNHPKEYKEFIDKEEKKKQIKVEDPYDKIVENIVISGKMEVLI